MYERQPNPERAHVDIVETTAPAATAYPYAERRFDKVRWGPVWAGLMTAITCFLIFQTFFLWIGAYEISVAGNNVTAGEAAPWISPIIALVSFFIGGWVCGTGIRSDRKMTGALNGFLVWALGTVLILVFASLGLGVAFGAVGNLFNQFGMAGRGAISSNEVGMFRDAAGWSLLFMLLAAGAATLGGLAGVKSDHDHVEA